MPDKDKPETVEPVKAKEPALTEAQIKKIADDAARAALADAQLPSKEWIRAEVELGRLGLTSEERAARNP